MVELSTIETGSTDSMCISYICMYYLACKYRVNVLWGTFKLQSVCKAAQELPFAYRFPLHRVGIITDTRLAEAAPLSPVAVPSSTTQILCQNAHNSQETGNGKVEGQWQTKATIYLSPASVKFWYAVGKALLPIRFNFPVRNCNYLLQTPCWPDTGQIMWRFIFPVSWSCRSNISNLSGRQDSEPVARQSDKLFVKLRINTISVVWALLGHSG